MVLTGCCVWARAWTGPLKIEAARRLLEILLRAPRGALEVFESLGAMFFGPGTLLLRVHSMVGIIVRAAVMFRPIV